MNSLTLLGAQLVLALVLAGGQNQGSPTIQGTIPPMEPARPALPIDEPPVVVRGERRAPLDPLQVKKQAAELSRLAQSIPPDIDKVSKGELPKELMARLKRIEKLSKQLRRELAH